MQINLDLTELALANTPLEGVIYSQVKTDIVFGVQNAENGNLNGNSCALLGVDGKTLAHAIISENKAVLDTNTAACYEYVSSLVIEEKRLAYLVVGSGDAPIAVLPIEVMRNPIANIAPPTALAPSYPTSEALQAILAEMRAQADRADDAVDATEKAQKAVAEYVDEVFPTKVEQAERTLANAVTDGTSAVTQTANQAIGAISSHTTTIIGALDTKQTQIEASIDGKVTEATTVIDGKVQEANDAKTDAVKAKDDAVTAKGQAEASATRAEVALNNGCVYEVRDIADASFTVDKTITIYKHEPTADTAYTFAMPTDASGKVCVFWLWIKMGETAHALTFPTSVEWLAEPSLGANTETLLALMSVDDGATWTANVQFEKAVAQ